VIRHVIAFNLKAELPDTEREWLFGQIKELSKLTSVRHLFFGKLLEPSEEWYRPRMWTEFNWIITIDFDDESGLYAYQHDPFHVTFAQEIRKRVSVIKVTDFVNMY
jgi:hypothetical protein